MRTLATLADSFQVRRVVWPASIAAGEATKLVTAGVRVMRTSTDAVLGLGGDAGVQDPDWLAVRT